MLIVNYHLKPGNRNILNNVLCGLKFSGNRRSFSAIGERIQKQKFYSIGLYEFNRII